MRHYHSLQLTQQQKRLGKHSTNILRIRSVDLVFCEQLQEQSLNKHMLPKHELVSWLSMCSEATAASPTKTLHCTIWDWRRLCPFGNTSWIRPIVHQPTNAWMNGWHWTSGRRCNCVCSATTMTTKDDNLICLVSIMEDKLAQSVAKFELFFQGEGFVRATSKCELHKKIFLLLLLLQSSIKLALANSITWRQWCEPVDISGQESTTKTKATTSPNSLSSHRQSLGMFLTHSPSRSWAQLVRRMFDRISACFHCAPKLFFMFIRKFTANNKKKKVPRQDNYVDDDIGHTIRSLLSRNKCSKTMPGQCCVSLWYTRIHFTHQLIIRNQTGLMMLAMMMVLDY